MTLGIIGFRRQIHGFRLVCVSCYELLINIMGVGILARACAEIIKILVREPRPFVALADRVTPLFQHGGIHGGLDSFPSGHATLFFALAVMVYKHDHRWGIVMFVLATLICLARIMAGVHYPLDILAGALLGMLVAGIMVRFDVRVFHKYHI
jgi:undecaprenyl-diphosphatase